AWEIMKLLILTCLVVAALARPKFPGRHPELIQNEPDSREEILKERQFSRFVLPTGRELREEHVMGDSAEAVYDQPFQQFYQLDAYPYALWFYPPQFMQPIAYPPFYDITKPTVSENIEKTDTVPEWW
ncbi:hypothetical protein MC885_011654, partial [Smutsia gigantea]